VSCCDHAVIVAPGDPDCSIGPHQARRLFDVAS
jgi:hypothetical protein